MRRLPPISRNAWHCEAKIVGPLVFRGGLRERILPCCIAQHNAFPLSNEISKVEAGGKRAGEDCCQELQKARIVIIFHLEEVISFKARQSVGAD
jgi:hypothetical protein